MSAFEKILGQKLVGKSASEVSTGSLADNEVIGLYFSAHWCGPCRNFTPKLAQTYKKLKEQGKKFEVVFISSDRDEKAFTEYFSSMPWLALPFSERDLKAKLSRKYKVEGIPTLVLLSPDGTTLTNNGRDVIADDEEGAQFPWKPKPFWELMPSTLVNNQKESVDISSVKQKPYFGLYFSAHWCPPCRAFTPQLIQTYKNLKKKGKEFEIIFISGDKDQQSFDDYFGTMPWLALPFTDRKAKEALNKQFEVEGIPTFIVLSNDGKIVNDRARSAVSADPEGEEFPWSPKPVNDLETAGGLDTALIYFSPKAEDKKALKDLLEPIAIEYKAGEDGDDIEFFYSGPTVLIDRIKEVSGERLPFDKETLLILNASEGTYYPFTGDLTGRPSPQVIKNFLTSWKKEELTPFSLS
eukprot:TRINITY_DN2656_c0_g1_i2.p1 TRINITY_DN2656_c0_g1~~TRINITY_DN2656_c0_g1_i2.p1  ORF type:complete len:410 (-),score=75.38 TRINITY_DN2656_c0_g1_i2:76-1305(-)